MTFKLRWTWGEADKYSVQMAGTAVVLQLVSILFCCGRCLVESDSEPEHFTSATQISGACDWQTDCWLAQTFLHMHDRGLATTSVCYTLPLYRIAVPLDAFSHTAVSGAFLQYDSTRLYDPQSNVTLTVGTIQRVYCVQAIGPLPTSTEWYNPQGQLVSRNNREEVNQGAVRDNNRASTLTFRSYQQSQGGTYECRVAGPGNNTESLLVCIGEGQVWGKAVDYWV